ncbi:MAG TPA: protein kinase [Terracidiphilus sp.]|nr:protein kinase [Terracidiphilus sp.]
MALQIGDRVGDYEVVALIGAGGMGRVYKVRSIISNRDEAMKVLLPDLTSEPDLAARFMVEIRTLAGLEHPNIAQLRTAFQFQNQLVMIMEFVEGATLEKLASESALPVDRVLDYATQVLAALSFAHSHGVIHRDIKPANIMITTHGQVKLMDFGIAKNADEMHLTRPGMTIGSVYYMSPEQVRGGTVDSRSDLYSFGITLYESLTGRKPFQADTSFSVLNAQLNEAPVPPIEVNTGLSPELNSIVLRALAKSPADRFQTAQEFHDALKALREPMASRPAAQPVAQPMVFTPVPTVVAAPATPSAGFTPVPTATPVPAQTVATAPPPFVPVPAATPVAGRAAKSHRGLWIGMGALAAILALVAIAWALPHVFSILAKQKATAPPQDATTASATNPSSNPPSNSSPNQGTSPQPGAQPPDSTQPGNPTGQPNAGGPANPSGGTAPAEGQGKAANPDQQGKSGSHPQGTGNSSQHQPPYTGAPSQAGNHGSASNAGSSGAGSPTGPATPSVPAGPSPQEIRQAHDRLMNLDARADAARAGVQSIRSQQQAQGLDIRGDILAAMNRMNSDLREAQTALNQNDMQAAGEYMDRADKEAAKLESFLGR